MTLKERILSLPESTFTNGRISIRPICSDEDLWYATEVCQLRPEQKEFVNSAAFSIGRAYLQPEDNIPCLIFCGAAPIGFILFRRWSEEAANSWSYYLDKNSQGLGYGTLAAELAIRILKDSDPKSPIKLSAERANEKAHHLYQKLGFSLSDQLDGDDLVFVL